MIKEWNGGDSSTESFIFDAKKNKRDEINNIMKFINSCKNTSMLKSGGFNRMKRYCHARRHNVRVLRAVSYYFVGESRGPGFTTK